MLDWLQDPAQPAALLPPAGILVARTLLAALLGFVVAGVYRLTNGRRGEAQSLPTTLVLLSVLIALVTLVIGNSVARAFGLVGALSIVRFRTVVEDTRDTAFVIFAVVVGMAAGAGYATLAAVGIPVVAAAAAAMARIDTVGNRAARAVHSLTVRLGLGHDPAVLTPVFEKYLSETRLIGVGTGRQGAALDFNYTVRLRDLAAMAGFVAELNRVDGVQSVEMREQG